MAPAVAPEGTSTFICVSVNEVMDDASTVPNRTFVDQVSGEKPFPLMVITLPGMPDVGLKEVISGPKTSKVPDRVTSSLAKWGRSLYRPYVRR